MEVALRAKRIQIRREINQALNHVNALPLLSLIQCYQNVFAILPPYYLIKLVSNVCGLSTKLERI
jgi:hypothetical protein